MISAQEALTKSTSPTDLQRMLLIADQKVKQAIAEKASSCCVLYPKHLYSEIDIRNFCSAASKLGYLIRIETGGNSYCLELRW